MKKPYEEKIKALFANEEFAKKFEALDDIEKIGQLFAEYGVEMSEAELADFVKAAIDANKGAELGEKDLEDVAGGAPWGAIGIAWGFAVDYWGGTRQAVNATYNFWRNVFR